MIYSKFIILYIILYIIYYIICSIIYIYIYIYILHTLYFDGCLYEFLFFFFFFFFFSKAENNIFLKKTVGQNFVIFFVFAENTNKLTWSRLLWNYLTIFFSIFTKNMINKCCLALA